MKKVLKKIFMPNKYLGFILFNLGFGLLIYVFSLHLEDTPLAYISYLLSTYALVIFIVWFCKVCKFSSNAFKNTRIYEFYNANYTKFFRLSLFISTLLNIAYCVFNFVVGIYYQSFWFITFAVYYLALSLMRISLFSQAKELGINLKQEYRKLRNCGIVLMTLTIVLAGMIVLILHTEEDISYSGVVIYAVAFYDFYLIITAFINVFKYKKSDKPILSASKFINLTVAMIAMLSLEVAMIQQFGDNDPNFKIIMTGIMGAFICFINAIMAIYMIWSANKNIRRLSA